MSCSLIKVSGCRDIKLRLKWLERIPVCHKFQVAHWKQAFTNSAYRTSEVLICSLKPPRQIQQRKELIGYNHNDLCSLTSLWFRPSQNMCDYEPWAYNRLFSDEMCGEKKKLFNSKLQNSWWVIQLRTIPVLSERSMSNLFPFYDFLQGEEKFIDFELGVGLCGWVGAIPWIETGWLNLIKVSVESPAALRLYRDLQKVPVLSKT